MNGVNAKWDHIKNRYHEIRELALEGREEAKESVVWKEDITSIYNAAWKWKIDNGRLITEQFNGTVRDGKSTVALERLREINNYLEKKYNKKIDNYECIASDQIEYLRLGKDENGEWIEGMKKEICYEMDEFSALGETGENSTTEAAAFKTDTDMNAVYHRHRIMCQPSGGIDTNADIILIVMGRDDKAQKTQCKVMYREISTQERLVIGHVWIDVSKTLKSKWYEKYQKKKIKRLELLDEHGYRDIRDVEKKMWTLEAFNRLKDEIIGTKKTDGIPSPSNIKLELESISQELKRPISSILRDSLVTNIHAILTLKWEAIHFKKITEKAILPDNKYEYSEKAKTVKIRLGKELARLGKANDIYIEYHNIK